MKNLILISLAVIGMTALMALKTAPNPGMEVTTGSYGVCLCESSSKQVASLKLTLNDDHTFHYVNNTDPDKLKDVKGIWSLEGEKVVLTGYDSEFPIRNKWKIDNNGKCLKARKGLNFTRICYLAAC